MKRICIVSFVGPYVLPYANEYLKTLQNSGTKITFVFWDRDAQGQELNQIEPSVELLPFIKKVSNETGKGVKAIGYLGAIRFIRHILRKRSYDGVIFLQTHAAIACADILISRYRKRYIVDIRDFTLENHYLYRRIEEHVIKNSFATVISSPAYKEFLPSFNYTVAHNYVPFSDEEIKSVIHRSRINKIRISFIGTIRFLEINKRLLQKFANHPRFELNYFGIGSENLEEYCEKNAIRNVTFHGRFSPEQTIEFYRKTDIINNLYGSGSPFLDFALSNKLYYAAQFRLPILVCRKTYMEQIAGECALGIVVDGTKNDLPGYVLNEYNAVDDNYAEVCCKKFVQTVVAENNSFLGIVQDFLSAEP